MKKRQLLFTTLFALALVIVCSAQSTTDFRAGYIISDNGDTIVCKIDAIRWPSIPNMVNYRLNGELFSIQRSDITEIGIDKRYKHVRHQVEIDRSSTDLDNLETDKYLEFEPASLLLEVLVEGPAVLYYYRRGDLKRLFFQVEGSPVEQLLYKLYRKEDGELGANLGYKQQLWEALRCDGLTLTEIGELEYDYREITGFFRKYNDCTSSDRAGFDQNARTKVLFASLIAGPHFGNFQYESAITAGRSTLGSAGGYSIGLDLEYVFGTRNSNWSAYFTPTYHSTTTNLKEGEVDVDLNLKMLKVPVGFRYNILQEGISKGHFDLGVVLSVEGDASLTLDPEPEEAVDVASAWAIGAGINFTKRIYARVQYVGPYTVQRTRTDPEIFHSFLFAGLAYRLTL
ncbi:MAG: hypothetical protein AAFN81_24250 [Bacteroidota bacterium]